MAASVCIFSNKKNQTASVFWLGQNIEPIKYSTRDGKRARIIPRDVFLAIHGDEELNILMKEVTISGGGVIPYINPVLLPAKTDKYLSKNFWEEIMSEIVVGQYTKPEYCFLNSIFLC